VRRPVGGGKDLTMHNAFLTHAGLSLWLEVALGLLLAVSLLVTAEWLARRAERGQQRMSPTYRTRSAPALTTDFAHG
jgi:hypothetical protein